MCGRITQDLNLKMLFDRYRLSAASSALNLELRYNGCPTQDFEAVRHAGEERRLAKLRWGRVPGWAKDHQDGRADDQCPLRDRAREARVPLGVPASGGASLPVNGWSEWRREGGEKQPHWLRLA